MPRQSRVPDPHGGDLGKGRLQRGQELGLQLAVQILTGEILRHIPADIFIEEHRVADPIGVFPKAADGDVYVQSDIGIHYPEGDRCGGAVFISHEFPGVEIVDPLIFRRFAAKGESFADLLKGLQDALSQRSVEDGGLGRSIVGIFTGFGAEFHDLSIFHDHHALTVRHCDDGAGGDDVVRTVVGGATGIAFLAFDCQHIFRQCITVKILFPLVRQDAGSGAVKCRNQTHSCSPFFDTFSYCS